ncbi:hypothetical protein [Methylobacterium aerolatum]|uniref:Uncharacterized protein n=1 Tax=Methylobacterium aerolatum TaxID=418708 RepID=A0ABU0I4Q2_9HYPH|nr:hypothetical protein [Methylobacterium aerolatum]MDQ0448855.1 hypothetical protein [Methylobacterium aerolatum]GJD34219.1 hypothetical protein FMGBMHLM_1115 [Methylobacterium aerolatum]
MTDTIRMVAKTTFHNPRVRNDKNGLVEEGDRFETDVAHARDLQRLGHAEAIEGALDGVEIPPLEPHHQVSQRDLDADRRRRRAAPAETA